MNLEKYKKFLDGLGTLKGISHPPRCGCAAQRGAPAESHQSVGDGGKWGPPRMPRSCRLPTEAAGGVALSTAPFHFPLLSFIWVWSDVSEHKGSAGAALTQPGRKAGPAASGTAGDGIELKILRKGTKPAGVSVGRGLIRL